MAQIVLIPRGRLAKGHWFAGPRSKYDHLRAAVLELDPDGAIFVTREDLVTGHDETGPEVRFLRRGIETHFKGKGLICVDDLKRAGVWVYRPLNAEPGTSLVIGPAKEDEIRRRPVDKRRRN